jgi:hypothetical protein
MKLSNCLSGSLLVLLALCGTSCSTPESAAPAAASNSGQYYVVSAREAKFFRYGPQQASGPDEELAQGTLVTLIRPTFGYRKVQLSNGLQGYVASQDIHPAPPELVQAVTNPNPTVSGTSEPNRNGRSRDNMVDPRFLPPPPALPEDQPEPTPIPGSEESPTP